MADFGQGGVRTLRTFTPIITVNGTAGEHLVYTLTVKGGMPNFVFTCAHQKQPPITSADKFQGHPKQVYSWKLWKKLPPNASSTDFAPDTMPTDAFGVEMSFLGAVKYTLQTDLHDGTGTKLRTLQDVDDASQIPTDIADEDLVVTWT